MPCVCVFCGSSVGRDPVYRDAAMDAARAIVGSGAAVVYGGGRVGLMGIVADAALDAGGTVIGVMPRALVEREIAHQRLHQLHVVETLQERKTRMAELADAFIALPGGAGTLDEIFEQWTWGQLGIHAKPCGFLNVKGYFDPLRAMIRSMIAEGFLVQRFADMLSFADSAETLLAGFRSYVPPPRKWSTADTAVHT